MVQTFNDLIKELSNDKLVDYLISYNIWVEHQLEIGGLIFSPKDYFGIWQGQVK